jgi:hypothetical protein
MPECRSSADHSFDFGSIVLPVGQQFQLQNNADAAYVLYVLILYNGSRGLCLACRSDEPKSEPNPFFISRVGIYKQMRCDLGCDVMIVMRHASGRHIHHLGS